MYTYIKSEDSLWTVGYYDPKGKWQPESDHDTPKEAADRVIVLNGGTLPVSSIVYPDEFKYLLSIAKRAAIIFENEANYPEGTIGYELRKDALEIINRIKQ